LVKESQQVASIQIDELENYRLLVESIHDQAIILLDHIGNVVSWNVGLQNLNGYPPNEIIGDHFSRFYTPEDIENGVPQSNLKQASSSGTFSEQNWRVRKDGSRYLANISINAIKDHANELIGFAKVFRDASAIMHKTMADHAAQDRSAIADAILITDASANIIRTNQSFRDLTGYTAEELQGKNTRVLASGRNDSAFYRSMWDTLLTKGSWTGEMLDKRKNGEVFKSLVSISAIKNDFGDTVEYVAVFKDLTKRSAESEFSHRLAYFDSLTNLPNRRLLMDRLQMSIASVTRAKSHGALLFLDIDDFKSVNDKHGHDYGDQLLIQVASRIRSCVREVDTVARLGGDEFVVLFEQLDARADRAWKKVGSITEKIRASLAAPYILKSKDFQNSPSIGVTLFGGEGCTIETILKQADLAMYHAKQSGGNAVRFFDPHMQKAVEARSLLESELSQAIPDRQLRLHYQLQVDSQMRPIGAEALVRWVHPSGEIIPPMRFIPIAEESSLILTVGQWVLEAGCEQLERWGRSETTRHLVLAVKVSAQQCKMPDFVEVVKLAISAHQIDPTKLRLEFSESVILNEEDDLLSKLNQLKSLGVKLALEDFGTGYSSLTYLRQLSIDQLKIDGNFVHEITGPNQDTVMVETILDMGNRFGLEMMAEGVESTAQRDFLNKYGCHAYQGYLFSKPLPIHEFEALLKH
jgi:diguanylate cyclase (GGDEF)-like protein/PAS domain S-box-containing protein